MVPTNNLELKPLDDQEIAWEMLMYAAYETSNVRESPLLAPYGADFGTLPGDLGVVVLLQEADDSEPVGAAWLRLMIYTGFGYVADDILSWRSPCFLTAKVVELERNYSYNYLQMFDKQVIATEVFP